MLPARALITTYYESAYILFYLRATFTTNEISHLFTFDRLVFWNTMVRVNNLLTPIWIFLPHLPVIVRIYTLYIPNHNVYHLLDLYLFQALNTYSVPKIVHIPKEIKCRLYSNLWLICTYNVVWAVW